jgi:hypothetical protein
VPCFKNIYLLCEPSAGFFKPVRIFLCGLERFFDAQNMSESYRIPSSHLPSSLAEVDPEWIASRENHQDHELCSVVIVCTFSPRWHSSESRHRGGISHPILWYTPHLCNNVGPRNHSKTGKIETQPLPVNSLFEGTDFVEPRSTSLPEGLIEINLRITGDYFLPVSPLT